MQNEASPLKPSMPRALQVGDQVVHLDATGKRSVGTVSWVNLQEGTAGVLSTPTEGMVYDLHTLELVRRQPKADTFGKPLHELSMDELSAEITSLREERSHAVNAWLESEREKEREMKPKASVRPAKKRSPLDGASTAELNELLALARKKGDGDQS